jgi:hypothetical protein
VKNPYEIRYKLTTFTVHDSGGSPEGKTYDWSGEEFCSEYCANKEAEYQQQERSKDDDERVQADD